MQKILPKKAVSFGQSGSLTNASGPDETRREQSIAMTRAALLTCLLAGALCGTASGGATSAVSSGGVRKMSTLEDLADIIIDISDDIEIRDADEDDETEERASKTTLCIAPPCGIVAAAVPLTDAPVPWLMRLNQA